MPILFGLFGLILIVSGVRGTVTSGNPSLVSLIKDDFTGTDPFWKWMLAILLIGAIGYIPNLRPISRAFMALAIAAFLLGENGNNGLQIFNEITSIFKTNSAVGTVQPTSTATQQPATDNILMPTGNVQGILNTPALMATGLNPLE